MTNKVPAKRESAGQPALPTLDHAEFAAIDTMAVDELQAMTLAIGPKLAMAERITEDHRRLVGKALWRLRLMMGEAEYGDHARQMAQTCGVTARTVGRWRTAAEDHFGLPPSSPRTEAQRATSAPRALVNADKLAQEAPSPTPSQQEGLAPEDGNPPEGDPAPAAPQSKRTGVKGEVAPKANTLTPPADEVFMESLNGALLAPADDGWEDCPRCTDCTRCGNKRKVPVVNKVDNGCGHPAIRRLGSKCQDCGAVVGHSPLSVRR